MNTRTGYFVKCINPRYTPFEMNEVLQVSSVQALPSGLLLLGFDNQSPAWYAECFEEVVVHSMYSDSVVVYEKPEETVEVARSELNQLLKDAQWLRALYTTNVRDWCGWSDAVEEFKRLEKENLE